MRRIRRRDKKHSLRGSLAIAGFMGFMAGMGIAMFFGDGKAGNADETALCSRSWETVEPVIRRKLGEGYEETGMCTGFVYWCLNHAYGVDWGSNSRVRELEDKIVAAGISRVEKGRSGAITEDMTPGDIVIFADRAARTHCAILGEEGMLYHADCSTGVREGPTLREWMELPHKDRNCDRYIIYRGIGTH